jgi:hypothetical protein
MPLQYYNPGAARPDAPAGGDLLKAALPNMVRPRLADVASTEIAKRQKVDLYPPSWEDLLMRRQSISYLSPYMQDIS